MPSSYDIATCVKWAHGRHLTDPILLTHIHTSPTITIQFFSSKKSLRFCRLPVMDIFASITDVDDESKTTAFTGGRLAR